MATELWRRCAEWLICCEILPADHKVTWPDAEVFDLAQTLRDGVLLCRLANKLVPGCIDLKDVSSRPQMSQFLCLKNIRTFLSACQHTFGMRPSELFDSFMLFDVTDFGKVLQALSKLSKTSKACATGILPFSADVQDECHGPDDEIYRHLEDMATSNDLMDEDPYRVVYAGDELEQEDVYEDLCAYRARRSLVGRVPDSHEAKPNKREYCIRELVETEKNYVDALEMIITHFARPLKHIISEEDHKTIFRHMDELRQIHTGFHSELLRAYNYSSPSFSECFLKWRDKFLVYGDFCSNLSQAQELIDDLCEARELVRQTVFNCQEKANGGRFKLRDLLSVPMQRVLKYHLLLRELIKQTPEDSDERPELQRALDALLDLSLYINEVKRDNETLEIILEIQNNITDLVMPEGLELKDYGHFLKDGELRIKSHADNRIKNRYVFLFDKVLLMCKPTRGQFYSYKEAIILAHYSIQEQTANLKRDKWSYCWVMYEKQKTMAYHMYAKTEEVKRKWIEAIQLAQDNTHPADLSITNHKFQLHSFDRPTVCTVCRKLLRGTFCQGYKCLITMCEAAVHKECILGSRCGRPRSNPSPGPIVLRPPQNHLGEYRVIKSYHSQLSGHLVLEDGDQVLLMSNNESAGLWRGHCLRSGHQGLFPRGHVEQLQVRPPSPQTGYVNWSHLWFVRDMEKEYAQQQLMNLPDGTFLVRTNRHDGGFRLAVKYLGVVKHIKIVNKKSPVECWYLAESHSFPSLEDLINWYANNSLAENFENLETTLAIPFKSVRGIGIIGYCVAIFDYKATATNQLSFRRGDRIAIIDKSGESKGWWKGELHDKIAYFPMTYVAEEKSDRDMHLQNS